MILEIPDKDDKDAQIEHLKSTLDEVKRLLEKKCCKHYFNDFEVIVSCIEAEDADSIVDFIGKRLRDVSY
jgi:hypothetical protein